MTVVPVSMPAKNPWEPVCGARGGAGRPVGVTLTEFDQRHYVKLIRARGETSIEYVNFQGNSCSSRCRR